VGSFGKEIDDAKILWHKEGGKADQTRVSPHRFIKGRFRKSQHKKLHQWGALREKKGRGGKQGLEVDPKWRLNNLPLGSKVLSGFRWR